MEAGAGPELLNDFESDEHRRVLANLGQPRSLDDLVRFLRRHDIENTSRARTDVGAEEILADLEADGLIVSLGTPAIGAEDLPTAIVGAVAEHPLALTLPEEKARHFVERVNHPDRPPFLASEEEVWVQTELGRAKLEAPSPIEGAPLAGLALKAAEERNAQIAEGDRELYAEGRRMHAQRLREEADRLEREADEL